MGKKWPSPTPQQRNSQIVYSDSEDEDNDSNNSEEEEMKMIVNNDEQLNFLSNHSSSRLTIFLCKALAPALITIMTVYSWLPILYIGVR